jgi:drug/metabolite transporter (DMT)-like permease
VPREPAPPPPAAAAGALATVYLVWGSTYLAIRVMVETVPPLLGAGLRFVFAGGVLIGWVWLRRGPQRVTWRELGVAATVGVLLMFGGNGVVTVAEQHVPSGLAALIIASEPLWVIVLRLAFRERLPRATLLGVAAGFAGVALLLLPGQRPSGVGLGSALLVVFAAASWAAGSYAGSRLATNSDPLRFTALQMLLGGGVMTLVGLGVGEAGDLHLGDVSATSGAAFFYLVVVGAIVAFTAYSWLLRNVPIATVSTYAYVNPVIAVVLGWAILSETVRWSTAVGAAIIVSSVAFTVRHEGVAREAEPAPAAPPAPPPSEPVRERAPVSVDA